MPNAADTTTKSQLDKFKQAARDLECDDDAESFRERVGKVAIPKPKGSKA